MEHDSYESDETKNDILEIEIDLDNNSDTGQTSNKHGHATYLHKWTELYNLIRKKYFLSNIPKLINLYQFNKKASDAKKSNEIYFSYHKQLLFRSFQTMVRKFTVINKKYRKIRMSQRLIRLAFKYLHNFRISIMKAASRTILAKKWKQFSFRIKLPSFLKIDWEILTKDILMGNRRQNLLLFQNKLNLRKKLYSFYDQIRRNRIIAQNSLFLKEKWLLAWRKKYVNKRRIRRMSLAMVASASNIYYAGAADNAAKRIQRWYRNARFYIKLDSIYDLENNYQLKLDDISNKRDTINSLDNIKSIEYSVDTMIQPNLLDQNDQILSPDWNIPLSQKCIQYYYYDMPMDNQIILNQTENSIKTNEEEENECPKNLESREFIAKNNSLKYKSKREEFIEKQLSNVYFDDVDLSFERQTFFTVNCISINTIAEFQKDRKIDLNVELTISIRDSKSSSYSYLKEKFYRPHRRRTKHLNYKRIYNISLDFPFRYCDLINLNKRHLYDFELSYDPVMKQGVDDEIDIVFKPVLFKPRLKFRELIKLNRVKSFIYSLNFFRSTLGERKYFMAHRAADLSSQSRKTSKYLKINFLANSCSKSEVKYPDDIESSSSRHHHNHHHKNHRKRSRKPTSVTDEFDLYNITSESATPNDTNAISHSSSWRSDISQQQNRELVFRFCDESQISSSTTFDDDSSRRRKRKRKHST